MRIPIKWLKEYVNTKSSAKEIADKLLMAGTEAELLKGFDIDPHVVVGEIMAIIPHPNADRLRIPTVKIGKDKKLDIVCGASNIEVGQKVPVALEGTVFGEFEIKETEIRGVKSKGMICSEQELGLAEHSEGIMVLEADAEVGKPLADILSNEKDVLEAEITPNRGDTLSMIGLARELAAVEKTKLNLPEINLKEGKEKIANFVEIEVDEKELCPRYVARVVKIKNNPESPVWLKNKLTSYGVRPISVVVDVTNFVMLEMGQPLHAFDFDKINGKKLSLKNKKEIIVRRAKQGEEIVTLDGVKRKLEKSDLIIADKKEAIAIAGVMGGKNTEVDEKTNIIVLESATFDKTSIRKTAQRLGLRSESSNRFEKGIPMPLNPIAIDRAAQLISEICGGEVLSGQVDVLNKWIWVQHVGLRISEVEKFLGEKIEEKEILEILRNVGFEAEKFDIAKEAKKLMGKPYVFGAKFKTHGESAFDCSYLTDYLYSKIGKFIGYTSLGQIEIGKPVDDKDLKPGDILFVKGVIEKSAVDHYFKPDGNGGYVKVVTNKYPKGVGHNGIYVGDGKVIHARHYQYDMKTNKWVKESKQGEVVEESVDVFLKNPEYLGARRFVDDISDFVATTVPWWRIDVSIEEDLFEEIARIYGYNNIKSTLPKGEIPVTTSAGKITDINNFKNLLVGMGFSEVLNYSFISEGWFNNLCLDTSKAIKVSNPISKEMELLRTSLIPSLLGNVQKNQNNFEEIKIFEISKTYLKKANNLAEEMTFLGGAVLGGHAAGIHYKDGKEFYIAKGTVENLFKNFSLSFERIDLPYLFKGRAAKVLISGKTVGFVGEISSEVLKKFGIKKKVAVLDINIEEVLKIGSFSKSYETFSKFPSISRDLAFVLSKNITAAQLLETISTVKAEEIKEFSVKDIYEGNELEGKKSVTVSVVYQSDKKTLKDEEIHGFESEIKKAVKNKLEGILR